MKTIFKIFSSVAVAGLAMVLSGCEKDGSGSGADTDATFRISITSVESDSARGAVISSAKDEQTTWLAFWTDDFTTPLADLVALEIVKLQGEGELESSLQYGNKPVTFSGLEPETEYLAVAAGVLSDGTVYGTPVSVRFTTERQLGVIEENPDWSVSYTGRFLDDYYTPYDLFHVDDNASSGEKFFTMFLDKATIDENFKDDDAGMKEFIEECVEIVEIEIIQAYAQEGITVTWEDLLYDGSTDIEYDISEPGDYYMTVIGMTDEGKYTGLYARETITLKAPAGSDDYNSWLGTWKCEDQDGTVNTITVSAAIGDLDSDDVDIDGESAGGIYIVDGWQAGTVAGEEVSAYSFSAFFMPASASAGTTSGSLMFYGYDMMEADFGTSGYGYIGLYGTAVVSGGGEDGEDLPLAVPGPLAGAQMNPDGNGNTATVTATTVDYDDDEATEPVALENMEFMARIAGSMFSLFDIETPSMPFTMTRVEEDGGNASSAARLSSGMGRMSIHAADRAAFICNPSGMSYKMAR